MKPLAYLLLILFLPVSFVVKAQQNLYFMDHPEVPPADGYRTGYIVTMKGDTVWGNLRNTESVGGILTPDGIYNPILNIQIKNYGTITKIAFQPYGSDGQPQKLSPADIRGFGCSASWLEQQIIEVASQYNKNGFIKVAALKKAFSLRDPYEDARLLQRTVHDHMAHYESWYIDSLHTTCFLQRLTEGKINLYYDNRFDKFYLTKSDDRSKLIYVNYNDDAFFKTAFGDSKAIAAVLEHSPEMSEQQNFLRVVGLYNLEAGGELVNKPDEVLLNNGDVMRGKLEMKGSSNLAFGIITRAVLTDIEGKKTELAGSDIKQITKYINARTVNFDAYSIKDGKRYFYQRLLSGRISVYYDTKTVITYLQKKDGDIQTSDQQYLVAKDEQLVEVSSKNYDERSDALFNDSPEFTKWLNERPDSKNFSHFINQVKVYNKYKN